MSEPINRVICPLRGAAHALQARTKQLLDLIYASKQYIHTIQVAISSAGNHQRTANPLNIEDPALNDLLTTDGLRMLLNELALSEEQTSAAIKEIDDSHSILDKQIILLNQELTPVKALLDKNRLGKEQHIKEQKLCAKANDVNQAIQKLKIACTDPFVRFANDDPYSICKYAQFAMDSYLQQEMEYSKLCFAEQLTEKNLESRVFSILQEIPVQYGKSISPVIDKCNEILRGVDDKVKSFHALTDWTAFELENAEKFMDEDFSCLILSTENHPDETFLQFQHIYEPDLQVYHKLRDKKGSSHVRNCHDSTLFAKLKDAKDKLTPTKRDFAIRGDWCISRKGYLYEFDEKEHRAISKFYLGETKIGQLAPDENLVYGYFTVRGRKILVGAEGKKKRKRNYRFRLPWNKATVFHGTLKSYCGGTLPHTFEMDESSSVSGLTSVSEDTTLVSRETSNIR